MKDIKRASIFGLIISIFYIIWEKISTSSTIIYFSVIRNIFTDEFCKNCFVYGLIIYFALILIKIIFDKGSIRLANIFLILSFIITTIWYFFNIKLKYLFSYTEVYGSTVLYALENVVNIIYTLTFIVFLVFLFYKNTKKMLTPLIIISIVKAIYTIFIVISALNYSQYYDDFSVYIISFILTLLILPYFKLYENGLSITNYQKETNSKSKDWIVMLVTSIIIVLTIVSKDYVLISIPKNRFEKLVSSLQNNTRNISTNTNYSNKTISKNGRKVTFKLVYPLKENSKSVETDSSAYFTGIKRASLKNSILVFIGEKEDVYLKSPGTIAKDFKKGTVATDLYKFTYNNKIYYYACNNSINVLISTKLKNGYYYYIQIDRKACATITLEELEGLLDVQ